MKRCPDELRLEPRSHLEANFQDLLRRRIVLDAEVAIRARIRRARCAARNDGQLHAVVRHVRAHTKKMAAAALTLAAGTCSLENEHEQDGF